MGWRDFLHVPKKYRRVRSGGEYLEDTSDVDLVAPRPTGSTPDLTIGISTLLTPGPLTSRDQESNGTHAIISRTIHLTALFFAQRRPPYGFRSEPIRSREKPKRWQPPKNPGSYC